MKTPPMEPKNIPPPPWWQGPIITIGFILGLLAMINFLSSCAEYPLSLSINSDKGSAKFSKSGIQITVEK